MLSHFVAVTQYPDDNARWTAVRSKDAAADKAFVYCVKTTKIYCRPTCKARLARCANVVFFDRPDEAEAAGYRACKRCQPQCDSFVPEADLKIAKTCVMLDALPEDAPLPRLEDLAAEVGLTKFHFHRSFKKATGLTPKEYVLANRQGKNIRSLDTSSYTSPDFSHHPASRKNTPALTHDCATPSDSFSPGNGLIATPNILYNELDAEIWQDLEPSGEIPLSEMLKNGDGDALLDLTSALQPYVCADSSTPPAAIEYTSVETSHGDLLMAFHEGKIVKLDLATPKENHLALLDSIYPTPFYSHTLLAPNDGSAQHSLHDQIAAVVEALERPSGKVLDLQLSSLFQDDLTT